MQVSVDLRESFTCPIKINDILYVLYIDKALKQGRLRFQYVKEGHR